MNDQRREIILGYILGALEESEIPRVEREIEQTESLRKELVLVRKELAPLHLIDEAFEPPRNLAEHTCKNIWRFIDNRSEDELRESEDQNCLKPILEQTATELSLAARKKVGPKTFGGDQRGAVDPKAWRWPDLIASITVGILIAFISFPIILHLKAVATNILCQNKLRNLESDISIMGPESFYANSSQGSGPFWRVNDPKTTFTPIKFNSNSIYLNPNYVPGDKPFGGGAQGSSYLIHEPSPVSVEALQKTFSNATMLPAADIPSEFRKNMTKTLDLSQDGDPLGLGKTNTVFFVESGTHVSGGAPFLHTGTGQNILFRDGRVFFRTIPANARQEPMDCVPLEFSRFPIILNAAPPSEAVLIRE